MKRQLQGLQTVGWRHITPTRIGSLLLTLLLVMTPLAVDARLWQQDDSTRAQADALFGAAMDDYNAGDNENAVVQFEKARQIYQQLGDDKRAAECLYMIGYIKELLKDFGGALEAYDASLALLQMLDYPEYKQTLHVFMGEILTQQRHYESALAHLRQAERIARDNLTAIQVSETLMSIGDLYRSQMLYEQSLTYYDEALSLARTAKRLNAQVLQSEILNARGIAKHRIGLYNQALDDFKRSLEIKSATFSETDDNAGVAEVQSNMGLVYLALGQTEDALKVLQQALGIQKTTQDRLAEATTLSTLGGVYFYLGQYDTALKTYQQVLDLAQTVDDPEQMAVALNGIGGVHIARAEFAAALEFFQQILDRYDENEYPNVVTTSLNNLATVLVYQGRYQEALTKFHRSLTIAQQNNDRLSQATVLTNLGATYDSQAQYGAALAAYLDALDIQQQINDSVGKGVTLNDLGLVYHEMGLYAEASSAFTESLAVRSQMNDRVGEGVTRNNLGELYGKLGRLKDDRESYDKALESFQQAIAIAQELRNRSKEMTTLNNIGVIYVDIEEYKDALTTYEQALDIARDTNDKQAEGITLNNIAELYIQQEQYDEALPKLLEASAIVTEAVDQAFMATLLTNIGYVYEQLHEATTAIEKYEAAIGLLEMTRGQLKAEELKTAFSHRQASVYERVVDLLWQQDRDVEAFTYTERARARAFLDQLGNQHVDFRRGTAPKLIEQEQALRENIIGLQNTMAAEGEKAQIDVTLQKEHSEQLEQARKQYANLLIRLKVANPAYADQVSVNQVGLAEIRDNVLEPETTLISYFVMAEHALAWVIDRQGSVIVDLPVTRQKLFGEVQTLRTSLEADDFDETTAGTLYDDLFAPLRPHIHHANLIIVPHDILHALPFATLQDADDTRFLIEDYTLTLAPSTSALPLIYGKRNPNEGRMLALGNPDGTLLAAESEVRAIAELYPGAIKLVRQDATEAQVFTRTGQIDILHLSAHGELNVDNPLFSRVVLTASAGYDGNLEVHEIYGMNLDGVNMVVLSACKSALGASSTGDELVGLTRAFLYAGTPSIIATLWSVEARATRKLMTSFYTYLSKGKTPATALQEAQIEMLRNDAYRPYHWAAFALTGDYRGGIKP